MKPDPKVIAELRTFFLDGATPSRLIRHILDRHPAEGQEKHRLIQDYFADAFHVPIVRNLRRDEIGSPDGLSFAYLNESLLHEIVAHLPEWRQDIPSGSASKQRWLDTLQATDDDQQFKQAQLTPPPELRSSWASLSEEERAFICQMVANGNHLYERSRILARLAERLQQQLGSVNR